MALTTIKPAGIKQSTSGSVAVGNLTYTGGLFSSRVPLVLNDISSQFDGSKAVFDLRLEQDSINTIVDSKDIQVMLNGQILVPYVNELEYPWICPVESIRGYRIKDGKITIFNAPNYGDQCVMIVRNTSQTSQTRRYPYSATNIALGD